MTTEPTPENPAFADLATLAGWLRGGQMTPVKLTEYCLARLERLGPKYHAVVTITAERAMTEARRAESELASGMDRGPLFGIPYGAKDLLAAKGAPTSWGIEALRERVIDEDAAAIARLASAGAVLVAKLATVELAGGMGYRQPDASFTGPGINPWNRSAWSGGSSTGPAAAVAAGLVPYALGTETWGSIVVPASYCGVTGLRPTYGLVSRRGALALSWTLDKIGVLARSARDAGLVLGTIAGHSPGDPHGLSGPDPLPPGGVAEPAERPYRLGVLPGALEGVQPEVAANFSAALEVLAAFADIRTIALPELPYDAATDLILSAEMSSSVEEWIGTDLSAGLRAPEDRIGGIANELLFAKDYLRALRIRAKAMAALDGLFAGADGVDALVAPATAAVASPLDKGFGEYSGRFRRTSLGAASNLVGLPAVVVPSGMGERGLPTALQFVGAALAEPVLLRIASEFQARTRHHLAFPNVEDA